MRQIVTVLIASIVFSMAACQNHKPSQYFPAGAVSDFEQKWFASHLSAMNEPILSPVGKGPDYFALRILFLPTWDRPVAVRYETDGVTATRRAVMLSGDGGYDPGKIKAEQNTTLTKQDMANIMNSLENTGFWNLPLKDDVTGVDGTMLIVETIHSGQYKVLVRWTPERETESRGLAHLVDFYTREFKNSGFLAEPGQ